MNLHRGCLVMLSTRFVELAIAFLVLSLSACIKAADDGNNLPTASLSDPAHVL